MSWAHFLFRFDGRINRGKYWLAALIYMIVTIVFVLFVVAAIGDINSDDLFSIAGAGLLVWSVGLILTIVFAWSWLATGVKRLHDRDRSGWWILLFWFGPSVASGLQATTTSLVAALFYGLVGLGIAIWGFIELGCLRGTAGPNRFGPDPLNRLSSEPLR